MKLQIIIEKGDQGLWGRLEAPDHLITTYGQTVEEITANIRMLIDDYLENEPETDPATGAVVRDPFWNGLQKAEDATFEYVYDLQAFFEQFPALNISKVAERAGINPGLMRQYASGVKHPSAEKAKEIETAIHELGKELLEVSIC